MDLASLPLDANWEMDGDGQTKLRHGFNRGQTIARSLTIVPGDHDPSSSSGAEGGGGGETQAGSGQAPPGGGASACTSRMPLVRDVGTGPLPLACHSGYGGPGRDASGGGGSGSRGSGGEGGEGGEEGRVSRTCRGFSGGGGSGSDGSKIVDLSGASSAVADVIDNIGDSVASAFVNIKQSIGERARRTTAAAPCLATRHATRNRCTHHLTSPHLRARGQRRQGAHAQR